MTDTARTNIMDTLSARLASTTLEERRHAVHTRIHARTRTLLDLEGDPQTLFEAHARAAQASLARVSSYDTCQGAVAAFLEQHPPPHKLTIAPDSRLKSLHSANNTVGSADIEDTVGVSHAFAGVAETGTLVFLCDHTNPKSLAYVCSIHIAVVHADSIVRVYEDVWEKMRTDNLSMPRSVDFITGPSRTGDVEQTIELGAHGPRHLHIIIVAP